MEVIYVLFFSACIYLAEIISAERLDGDNIFGAILPVHKPGVQGKPCGLINTQGVAVAEAMKLAVNTINSKKSLLGTNPFSRTLGYDLRDSCDNVEKAKDIAYDFNKLYRSYQKNKQSKAPVSAILARFNSNETSVMELLAFENLPQMSYAADNVKLRPTSTVKRKSDKLLFSLHPGDVYKLKAAVAIIKALQIEYVPLVVSKNKRGRAAVAVIKTEFMNNINSCHSDEFFIDSQLSVKHTISKLKSSSLANVVFLQLDRKQSLMLFKEASQQNLTNIIWFSTIPWKENMNDLKPYSRVVEGMLVVDNKKQDATGFQIHLSTLKRPYNNSVMIQELFIQTGGSKECIESASNMSSSDENKCDAMQRKMVQEILKYKSDAAYAIDAVFAFAHAIQNKASSKNLQLMDALKSVKFMSPMTRNIVNFDANGVAFDVVNVVYNMQESSSSNGNKMELIQSGTWDRGDIQLSLNRKILRWKYGSESIPVSKCSPDCMKGSKRMTRKRGPQCCWTCEHCPTGTVSGANNSASCSQCGKQQVANPDQTSCFNFKKISFKWFEPFGEFMMFFITAGLCLTFFTLGIFSQNRECDVVKSADYKIMVFMLFGLALCFFAPVPLLLEPSSATCISYVIMFNFGLTIPLATLFSKSASVRHRFFDENMELKNGSLGSKPHLLVIAAVLILQIIILSIGIRFTPTYIEYHATENWDVKYAECSYVKNAVFWIAFGYNMILSIVLTFLSCKSVKMDEDFKELKWVSITTCCFYCMCFIFITCIYSVYGKHVVEAASICIVLFGFMFLIAYFMPKLRLILYHQPKKDLGPDGKPLMAEEEHNQDVKLSPHISGIAAFGKMRVLAVKVRTKKSNDKEPIASGSQA